MNIIQNALEQSHALMAAAVRPGDSVVDATAGNGHDTLMLAELAGDAGLVYAFDIQQEAIDNTRSRLEAKGLLRRVRLIHAGHENMEMHVPGNLSAVLFNLGYLPGGDRNICTQAETTIRAIEGALQMLQKGGIIVLVVYRGKDTGFEEYTSLMAYIRGMDPSLCTVMTVAFPNQVNNPPLLVCIEK